MTTLAEAMKIVREAPAEEKMKIDMWEATKDVDFRQEIARGVPGPSLGGIDPRNSAVIEATKRSHAAMIARDRVSSERQAASREKAAETLAAGQTPANSAIIRREVRGAGA